MAISHVCLGCGMELARVRAGVEPHYGLRLVTCPSCGTSAVRRRSDLVEMYRRWRRLRQSVGGLVLRAAFTAFLMAVVVTGIIGIVNDMAGVRATPQSVAVALFSGDETSRVRDWVLNEGLFGIVFWGSLCVITGMWLTAGVAHLSRVVWLVWAAALLVLVNIEWVLFPLLRAYGNWIGDPFTDHVPPESVMQSRLVMTAAAAALAGVGVPLGQRWAALWAKNRRMRAGRYRARRRRLEKGHAG